MNSTARSQDHVRYVAEGAGVRAITPDAVDTPQARDLGHGHVTEIGPPRGWRMLDWRELWAYRELLFVLTARDVKVRYKQAVLGAGWAIIRPFLTMIVFSVIFGALARMPSEGYPYPVFVYAALLPWTFFSNAISASSGSLIASSHLVSRVYFPRLIIPLSSVGAGLLDLLISTAILLAMMAWYGIGFSWNLLAAPLLSAALVVAALGTGTLLSALTVSYRDFTHVTPFLLQIWLYVTPVVFPLTLAPERWRWLLYLNPMTGLIDGFRSAFLGKPFDWMAIGVSIAISIGVFVLGVAYFERVERRFADII